MYIAIDFDGTIVFHAYPQIGDEVPHAIRVMKELQAEHDLILWTMRSGSYLDEAIRWLEERGIELFGINENPTQGEWTSSPKAYAQIYIDDAAIGCPTIRVGEFNRPYVDWLRIEELLVENAYKGEMW